MKRELAAAGGAVVAVALFLTGYLGWEQAVPRKGADSEPLRLSEGAPRETDAIKIAGDSAPEEAAPAPSRADESRQDALDTPSARTDIPENPEALENPESPGPSPSFDIVRVEPSGESVIAGRAAPNTRIAVLQDGEPLAETRSNARGEFVAIPLQPLAPGEREITLESHGTDGRVRESEQAVIVAIPDPVVRSGQPEEPADPQVQARERQPTDEADTAAKAIVQAEEASRQPLAVAVSRSGAGNVQVLQRPEPEAAPRAGRLTLESVQYALNGRVVVAGYATPGHRVRVLLNARAIAAGAVATDGRWRVEPEAEIAAGLHTLKVEELDGEGRVRAEVETPFNSQPMLTPDEGERLLVVQPGHNLWTIARRTYGEGWLYTAIFRANREQIDDEDLIYPGQVFVLPETEPR